MNTYTFQWHHKKIVLLPFTSKPSHNEPTTRQSLPISEIKQRLTPISPAPKLRPNYFTIASPISFSATKPDYLMALIISNFKPENLVVPHPLQLLLKEYQDRAPVELPAELPLMQDI